VPHHAETKTDSQKGPVNIASKALQEAA